MRLMSVTALVALMTFACGGAPQESSGGATTQELSGETGKTLRDDVNYNNEPPPAVGGEPQACPDAAFEACTSKNGDGTVTLDGACLQRECEKKAELGVDIAHGEPPPGFVGEPPACSDAAFEACTSKNGDGTVTLDGACLQRECEKKAELNGEALLVDPPPASEPPPGTASKPKYCPASAFQACTIKQGDSKSGTSYLDKKCLEEKCSLKVTPLAQ